MLLQSQIAFINEMCGPILSTLAQFESQKPCTLIAYDRLEELLITSEANALTVECMDVKFHQNCSNLTLERRTENLQHFKSAFQGAADKLHKYVSESPGGQPAIKFLKAVRIFDPARVCVIRHHADDYKIIPGFESIPRHEFGLYVDRLTPDAVAVAGGLWSTDRDAEIVWQSMRERLPCMARLALTYINAVCNSADAERSNSLYNLILDNRRRSLSEESIKALLFLYYNNNV
jgi:hAT family C-terminal dimerisation region